MAQSDDGAGKAKNSRWRDVFGGLVSLALGFLWIALIADWWADWSTDRTQKAEERAWAEKLGGSTGFPMNPERAKARISKGYPATGIDKAGWDSAYLLKDQSLSWSRTTHDGFWYVATEPDGRLAAISFMPYRDEASSAESARLALRTILWVVAPKAKDSPEVEATIAAAAASPSGEAWMTVDGGAVELKRLAGGGWGAWAFSERVAARERASKAAIAAEPAKGVR